MTPPQLSRPRAPIGRAVGTRAGSRTRGQGAARGLAVSRDLIQLVLLVFATVWGVYTFVYKEIWVPSRAAAALVVKPTLEEIGRKGDTILVRASMVLSNPGDVRVYVPVATFTALGLRMETRNDADSVFTRELKDAAAQGRSHARFSRTGSTEVLATGPVLTTMESWFDPGYEQRHDRLFYIPADRFDAAMLTVEYIVAKDIREIARIQWEVDEMGALLARPVFKLRGYDQDSSRVEPWADGDSKHKAWERRARASASFAAATLPLWKAPVPQ